MYFKYKIIDTTSLLITVYSRNNGIIRSMVVPQK